MCTSKIKIITFHPVRFSDKTQLYARKLYREGYIRQRTRETDEGMVLRVRNRKKNIVLSAKSSSKINHDKMDTA